MKRIRFYTILVLCFLLFFACCLQAYTHRIVIDQNLHPPQASIIKNVPFVAQMPYFCGPASAEMVLKYHGINKLDQVEIASSDSKNTKGTHWQKLVNHLNRKLNKDGIAANTVYGDLNLLKKYIASGHPVLVRQWRNRNKPSRHYRVVVGYDDNMNRIIYHDPKIRANMKMDYQLFIDLWNIQVPSVHWSSINLMIIIGKINPKPSS